MPGKQYAEHITRGPLRGRSFDIEVLSGSKWIRAKPMSSAAKAHNIKIVLAPWNKDFFEEAEAFGPDEDKYPHDDIVDALSSAFNYLADHRGEIAWQSAKPAAVQPDPRGNIQEDAPGLLAAAWRNQSPRSPRASSFRLIFRSRGRPATKR